MDDDSDESAVEDKVVDVRRDESDWEWLVRGCRREADIGIIGIKPTLLAHLSDEAIVLPHQVA